MEEAAFKMAEQQGRMMYESIGQATGEAGTAVSGKGKPVSAELLIQALELIVIDFDEEGRPRWPTMHVHPSGLQALQKALIDVSEDLEKRQRTERLIEKKRDEWRTREASRKLVG